MGAGTLVVLPLAAGREARHRPRPLTGLAIDPHQWKWELNMDDNETKSAGPIEPASDLSDIAAHSAVSIFWADRTQTDIPTMSLNQAPPASFEN